MALPEGFTLDQPAQRPQQSQALPEGFTLDAAQLTPEQQTIVTQAEARIKVLQGELDTINQSRNDPGFLEQAFAGAEGLVALVSGAAAVPISGVVGLAAAADPFAAPGAGAETQRQVQEALTFEPQLPGAKAALEDIGGAIETVSDIGTTGVAGLTAGIQGAIEQDPVKAAAVFRDIQERGVGETIGSQVAETTGSPVLGAIARTIPEAALITTPFKASSVTSKFGKNLLKQKKPTEFKDLSASQKQRLIAEEVRTGNPNIDSVTQFITEKGNLATSKASNKALKSKFLGNENQTAKTVSVFERADNATKGGINKMLNIIETSRKQPKFLGRTSDVVGDSMARRVQAASTVNKNAGKQIGAIAKSLKNKQVNISAARNKFFSDMEELGVTFKTAEDGFVTVDLSRSDFVGGSQKQLNVMTNKLLNDNVGFEVAHKLKRSIRDNLKFDITGPGKIDEGASAKILRDLSGGIDQVLDGVSPRYDSANIRFAKTKDIVDKFQKLAGKDVDLFSDTAALVLANKAKRVTSNAVSGPTIRADIAAIDDILKDLGITFKDDIQSLLLASDDLERIFDLAASNSLKGNILDAGRKLARGDLPIEETVGFIKKAFTPSEQKLFAQKIKVLRDLSKVKGKKQ